MTRIAGLFCLIVIGFAVWAAPVLACPNCKAAVSSNSDYMALGFAWSIVLMLSVPALIVTGWVIALVRLTREVRISSVANPTPHPLPAE
jgi:hypothetical protein